MIKKNLKTLIATSIITLLPIIAGLILWSSLPDQMPMHWNAAGEVDGFAPKWVAVFLSPVIMLAVQWLCALVTSMDPKQKNIADKPMTLVLWIIPLLTLLLSTLMYLVAMGYQISVETIVPGFMGIVLALIGNYLPKCKQTYTLGIKLPWTLADEENWNKTHRLAGKLWTIGGIVIAVLAFFNCLLVEIGILVIMVFVPTVYSYLLYKKSGQNT